jgi:hypothetical protein
VFLASAGQQRGALSPSAPASVGPLCTSTSPTSRPLLAAWHQQHVLSQRQVLTALRDQGGSPEHRLRAVLEAYARICQHGGRHADSQLGALLQDRRSAMCSVSCRRFALVLTGLMAT